MSSVLTWARSGAALPVSSERLAALRESHHAMWNYVTYRDAIGILGMDADALYPGGITRLDPTEWADLGWLTCFSGPPDAAVAAMRAAVSAEALNQYTPDLIEPLRDAAAELLGRERDGTFEVIGTAGAQEGISLALMASVDPGDEVIVSDPGYFHVPSAIIAAGGRPVPVAVDRSRGYRLDPDAVAAAVTPRTRAIVLVDPLNPYGTVARPDEVAALVELCERRGMLLVDDVTHGAIALSPGPLSVASAMTDTEHAVATFSMSHCWGMAGARVGFLAGPRALMRACLQLKAGLTRLNTNLVSQHAALAALGDADYLPRAAATVARNLDHLEQTLTAHPALRLAVRPERGLACAVEVDPAVTSPQELMVALFARRIAVYPGDGLGETTAEDTLRINLSRPDPWAMEHLRASLGEALDDAAAGRWQRQVADLLDGKGTGRAQALAERIRAR